MAFLHGSRRQLLTIIIMYQLLKYLAALAAASALVVRDGNELRAALANGASTIELAADAYLGGEVAINLVFLGLQYVSVTSRTRSKKSA